MNLYHYSRNRVTLDGWEQRDPVSNHHKPIGLWLSADDYSPSWPEWCAEESFCTGNLTNRHRVKVDTRRIAVLTEAHEVLEFGEKYPHPEGIRHYSLDWARVCNDWDGLIIAPYQFSLRFDDRTNWYYTWDCASGCVWNKSAILSIEHMEDNPWRSKVSALL